MVIEVSVSLKRTISGRLERSHATELSKIKVTCHSPLNHLFVSGEWSILLVCLWLSTTLLILLLPFFQGSWPRFAARQISRKRQCAICTRRSRLRQGGPSRVFIFGSKNRETSVHIQRLQRWIFSKRPPQFSQSHAFARFVARPSCTKLPSAADGTASRT